MMLQYWFMFPVATVIATVAMSSSIGGGVFFAPIMILVLKLPPQVAIGAGLVTQAFGLSSGLLIVVAILTTGEVILWSRQ